jgi:hypothetical protein
VSLLGRGPVVSSCEFQRRGIRFVSDLAQDSLIRAREVHSELHIRAEVRTSMTLVMGPSNARIFLLLIARATVSDRTDMSTRVHAFAQDYSL